MSTTRPSRSRRAAAATVVAVAVLAGTAVTVSARPLASRPVPQHAPTRLAAGGGVQPIPAEAERPVTRHVGSRADFVAQTNFVQCVGASMQMMLNMIEPGRDKTAKTQLRLQRLARKESGPRPGGGERQGASVRGWSAGLNSLGAGPYRLVGTDTLQEALRTAAKAISETGKPVGLLVWRGRHAWVMSGFTATADPLFTDDYTVTHAVIYDPLSPHGSKVWGPSPRPGATLTAKQVGRQFVPRRMSTRWLGDGGIFAGNSFGGKYVLVLPYLPANGALPVHLL